MRRICFVAAAVAMYAFLLVLAIAGPQHAPALIGIAFLVTLLAIVIFGAPGRGSRPRAKRNKQGRTNTDGSSPPEWTPAPSSGTPTTAPDRRYPKLSEEQKRRLLPQVKRYLELNRPPASKLLQ